MRRYYDCDLIISTPGWQLLRISGVCGQYTRRYCGHCRTRHDRFFLNVQLRNLRRHSRDVVGKHLVTDTLIVNLHGFGRGA